jgi:hypothetical protein
MTILIPKMKRCLFDRLLARKRISSRTSCGSLKVPRSKSQKLSAMALEDLGLDADDIGIVGGSDLS